MAKRARVRRAVASSLPRYDEDTAPPALAWTIRMVALHRNHPLTSLVLIYFRMYGYRTRSQAVSDIMHAKDWLKDNSAL